MTDGGAQLVVSAHDFLLQLDGDSTTQIPRQELQPGGTIPPILSNASDDVAALQAAILQGNDPTQAFEATAAGIEQPVATTGEGSGNGGFVVVSRTGESVIAETGFDTDFAPLVVDTEEQPEDALPAGEDDTLGITPLNGTISLAAPGSITEGAFITVVATLDTAPVTDLQITLSNGQMIVIPAGEAEGRVSFESRADDAYAQGNESLVLGITGVEGGDYEALDSSTTTTVTVADDADVTTVSLEAPASVVEGTAITVTARVDQAPASDVRLTLSNGEIITIAAGETEGSVSFASRADDVHAQGDGVLALSITATEGGDYEALDSSTTTTVTVADDADVTTVSLEAPASVVEGTAITVTARVDQAPASDVRLTLSNGEIITIAAGETEGSVSFASRADDVHAQGDGVLALSITATEGGDYEALDSSTTTTVTVADDADVTTVSLEAPASVVEGTAITVTARVDQAPASDVRLTLSNGEIITIAAGETEGSVSF
ncbi:large adhesive protein, partial [Zobellella endophytica]